MVNTRTVCVCVCESTSAWGLKLLKVRTCGKSLPTDSDFSLWVNQGKLSDTMIYSSLTDSANVKSSLFPVSRDVTQKRHVDQKVNCVVFTSQRQSPLYFITRWKHLEICKFSSQKKLALTVSPSSYLHRLPVEVFKAKVSFGCKKRQWTHFV
jgi:hypothetical protein